MNEITFKPFTLVFDKDIRDIKENPFQIETVFGTPTAISRGDLTEKTSELECEVGRLQAENKALREAGELLIEAEVSIQGAWEAIMHAWMDKASPDIIKLTIENREKLFAACRQWRGLVPLVPSKTEGGEG